MAIKKVASVDAATTSNIIIPSAGNPFNIGFGVALTGTATYTVQHTFDNVTWYAHETVVNATSNQDGNYAYPIAGIRLNVSSLTSGTVTITTLQAN